MSKPMLIAVLLISSLSGVLYAKDSAEPGTSDSIRIDSIVLERNWMTWDLIILNELEFGEGDVVAYPDIENAITRLWNIGNFAKVRYSISNLDGVNVLTITALDAVRFYPQISLDHSSKDDYSYQLGYSDANFLGSNSSLLIAWTTQPIGSSWNFRLNLPRQYLYKNMTLGFGVNTGHSVLRYLERVIINNENNALELVEYVPLMFAPYRNFEVYTSIGNPWNLDYGYRFSPNLSIGYKKHDADYSLLSEEDLEYGVELEPFNNQFLSVTISESVGMINRKRHRKDGYLVSLDYSINLGLTPESPTYQSIGFSAEYHNSLTKLLQLSTWVRSGFTNADDPYKFIKGSGDVLGLRMGEIFGGAYYSAYLGAHFTWLNETWLAVDNAYFFNWGTGNDRYFRLFSEKPFMAIGTSFAFHVPVAPFISAKITFMYAGPGTEWFKFQM